MSRFAPPALSLVADPKMLRDQQWGPEAYSQHDEFLPWWVTMETNWGKWIKIEIKKIPVHT